MNTFECVSSMVHILDGNSEHVTYIKENRIFVMPLTNQIIEIAPYAAGY